MCWRQESMNILRFTTRLLPMALEEEYDLTDHSCRA